MYVDAHFDRQKDVIHVTERINGKRVFREYPPNYMFYYKDQRGKYESIFGDKLSRFSTTNGRSFKKEKKIYGGQQLFESDVNQVFKCLENNYLGKEPPKLNTAFFDIEVDLVAESIAPQVTWGTSPEMVAAVTSFVPTLDEQPSEEKRKGLERALEYMGLEAGQAIESIAVDRVFIGSCTNSRIEDMRAAALIAKGRQVAGSVKQVLVVPGSQMVKAQAEAEGLDKIFMAAGMDWREPGCSMCLAMNADKLGSGEHCASTSNRNFEGRQGSGGRTHLMSPAMAAAAAIAGHITDVRAFSGVNS